MPTEGQQQRLELQLEPSPGEPGASQGQATYLALHFPLL